VTALLAFCSVGVTNFLLMTILHAVITIGEGESESAERKVKESKGKAQASGSFRREAQNRPPTVLGRSAGLAEWL
jgi:hypothetical protein